MPPSSPSAGRMASSTRSARQITAAVTVTCGTAFFSSITGRSSCKANSRERHTSASGQIKQAGLAGVQMVAPRSIKAWL